MITDVDQVTLTAPDISCAHCVATVQAALGAFDGVDRIEASAETKQVTVAFDPVRVSLERITAALGEAGYPTVS
jgi:copper ion binding protein